MPKRIIAVGVASGLASRAAVRWVMRRAAADGSAVLLVHVVDGMSTLVRVVDGGERQEQSAREFLALERTYAQSLDTGVDVRTRQLRGNAMWELVGVSSGVDIVAVGTHKTGFIHGTVFGSTSLHLVAAAHCPVVIVPMTASGRARGVVVGVDDSAAGRAALDFGAAQAAAMHQDLILIRAWQSLHGDTETSASSSAAAATDDATIGTFATRARATDSGLRVRSMRIRGATAPVLIAFASSADVLVLGGSRSAGALTAVLGSVCHDAVMNITCPTAIVHSPVRESELEDRDRIRAQPVVA